MASPIVQITTHEADAKTRLPGWLATSTNYQSLLDVLVKPYQNIEDLFIAILDGLSIETAIGVQLDVIGAILDMARTSVGEPDADYRVRLFGRAAELSASGEAEIIITTWLSIWAANSVKYKDIGIAAFEVTALLDVDPNDPDQDAAAIEAIRTAKAGGVRAVLLLVEENAFIWGDAAAADANGDLPADADHGWGDEGDDKATGIWTQDGNVLADLPGSAGLAVAAMTGGTHAVVAESDADTIEMFQFDGTDWSSVGTPLSVGTINNPGMCALNSTDIAFLDLSSQLEYYRYNYSTGIWTQVGSGTAVSGSFAGLAALNSTDVAVISSTLDELRTYRWGGSSWSLVGNGLTLAVGGVDLTMMDSTSIALLDNNNNELRKYSFDGSDWAQVGNGESISVGTPAIAALNDIQVVVQGSSFDKLRVYEFDGLNWTQVGSDFAMSLITPSMDRMNGHSVVVFAQSLGLGKYNTGTEGITPGPGKGGNFARAL